MLTKNRLAGILLLIPLSLSFFFFAEAADGACGAAKSSCKTCHEVKKEMPVANSGQYHVDHAFGDFCESCHGGVVKSQVKSEAHQGMRDPLADAQSSCGLCHVTDLQERAQVYGAALNSTPPGGSNGGGSGGGQVAKLEMVSAEEVPPQDLIDYNRVLLELKGLEEQPGNKVLVLLNLAMAAILLALIWKYDWRRIAAAASEAAANKENDDTGSKGMAGALSQTELDALDSILERPEGRLVLSRLFEHNSGKGEA